jgi:hypothetical protein
MGVLKKSSKVNIIYGKRYFKRVQIILNYSANIGSAGSVTN